MHKHLSHSLINLKFVALSTELGAQTLCMLAARQRREASSEHLQRIGRWDFVWQHQGCENPPASHRVIRAIQARNPEEQKRASWGFPPSGAQKVRKESH